MALSTLFWGSMLFLAVAGGIAWLVIDYRNANKVKAGKLVVNHLHRFTKTHRHGNLVGKPIPIGKDKKLLRINFSSKEENDEGKTIPVKQTIIAHKDYIIETEDRMDILPKNPEDVEEVFNNEKIKVYIRKIRDINTIVKAEEESYDNLSKVFIEHRRGDLSGQILKEISDLKYFFKEKQEEAPKEEEKKKP